MPAEKFNKAGPNITCVYGGKGIRAPAVTSFVARAWGKKQFHPYWHKDVIQTASNIHPAFKIRDGREKAFFRAAMEPYVRMSTARRKRIGIHHGGGLQGGIDATFGGRDRKIKANSNTFKALTARLLVDPYASIEDLAPHPTQAKSVAHHTNGSLGKAGITPPGAGVLVHDAGAIGNLTDLATTIHKERSRACFTLVKNLPLSEDQFKIHAKKSAHQ